MESTPDPLANETMPFHTMDNREEDLGEWCGDYRIDLNDLIAVDGYSDPVYGQIGAMVDAMLDGLPPSLVTSRRRELEKETLKKNGWDRYPVSGGRQPRFKYVNRHTKQETTALNKALSMCPKSRRRRNSKAHP